MRGDPCIDCNRIAAGIAKRVNEVLAAQEAQEPAEELADIVAQPKEIPAVPQPLPEAPASVNVRVVIGGREVQWTLRDSDEARLAVRLEALLARYPLPQPAPQASTSSQGQGEGWCSLHGVQMTLNNKNGRQWWSHRLADGQWCKGRQGR